MTYVLLIILIGIILVLGNLFIVIGKLFDSIHIRDSKALGGKKIIFPEDHPLYSATMTFKKSSHDIWTINKDGLQLKAFYYAQEKSQKTIILTHGFSATHNSLNIFGQLFYKLGFNVLMPDNRAAGISEGKYLSFGFNEQSDLLAWIEQVNKKTPDQRILLFGASMGAATVLQVSDKQLPENVLAIIEDSSYTTTSDIIEFHAQKKVGKLARFVLPLLSFCSKLKLGFFYKEASPIAAIQNSQLPILFIVSGNDAIVPPFMGQKLYDSYQGQKEFYEDSKGIHIRAYNHNPQAYELKINEFLNKYFKA